MGLISKGLGLPEDMPPGKLRLTGNRAKVVTSGKSRSQADLARNGNFHTPVVDYARSGDSSKRYMKPPEDPFRE